MRVTQSIIVPFNDSFPLLIALFIYLFSLKFDSLQTDSQPHIHRHKKTCLHFFNFISFPFSILHITHPRNAIRSMSLSPVIFFCRLHFTERRVENENSTQTKMNYVLLFHLLCVFIYQLTNRGN